MTRGIIGQRDDGILRGITTTAGKTPHTHHFQVDEQGFGQTTPDSSGHTHGILAWTVVPAGSDAHDHEIDKNAVKSKADRGRYSVVKEPK